MAVFRLEILSAQVVSVQVDCRQSEGSDGQDEPEELQHKDLQHAHQHPKHHRNYLSVPKYRRVDFVVLNRIRLLRLEFPNFFSVFVDDSPPPKSRENSPRQVFHHPKVQNAENGHEDEDGDAIEYEPREQVGEYAEELEKHVEDADDRIGGLRHSQSVEDVLL